MAKNQVELRVMAAAVAERGWAMWWKVKEGARRPRTGRFADGYRPILEDIEEGT
jgi:hypothetical protein